jgi:AcrR family transcriptional regulator
MTSRAPAPAFAESRQPVRRRLPGPERRVLILNAALRTFAANGYDGAAMEEIAAAAGISKAVVYDHVASKRELYTHLLELVHRDLERTIKEALSASETDEARRLHAAADALFRYVEEQPEAFRLLLLELQGASVTPLGRELEERITDGLAQRLDGELDLFDGHPDRARQVRIFAELLKSAVLGLARWWHRHPEIPREDLVAHTVALVWPAIEHARGPRSDPAAGA